MTRPLVLILVIAFFAACDSDNNPTPTAPNLVPVKLEEQNYTKELFYDAAGKLKEVSSETRFVDGSRHKLQQTLIYNANGRLVESVTDAGSHMIYVYDDKDRIVQTDEYENSNWKQKHVYHYNSKGLITDRITYHNIPDEGGVVPVSEEAYDYDSKGNVSRQQLYKYERNEAKLLTTYLLSEYDNKINTDEYFDTHPFNPLLTIRKNNPGKLVTQNALGFTTSMETYTYRYNDQHYAIEKTTAVTYYNGNTGSYTTQYTFRNK